MGIPISRREPMSGEFKAPASKPQTQRALIMAALADGLTTIRSPLMARETSVMIEACRSLGADVYSRNDQLDVRGIGSISKNNLAPPPQASARYIWAAGSALVARVFLTIGSALPDNVIIDGKCNLRVRPFEPLTAVLRCKGVEFGFFDAQDCLPCTVLSAALPGGHYRLTTDISSQFATALLVSAPLAVSSLCIELTGPTYSGSYIRQTIDMMSSFGVAVETEDDLRRISVSSGQSYRAREVKITGDYTSASYILGAAFITRGHIRLSNLDPGSLQGEIAIVNILAEMGARIRWVQGANTLIVDCADLSGLVDATFDLSDYPNILPTVAAVAATVPGRVRIVGGRLTQNHKSRRIDAMAEELSRAGVAVEVLKDEDGLVDGLDIRGKGYYEGGVVFSSHEDHRIVMAITLFTLACSRPCSFSGTADTADSFPEFVDYLGSRAGSA